MRRRPFDIDWQRCLLNLRQSGLPIQQAANEVGHRDKGQYLQRVARGETRRMEFVTGVLLLNLHLERCPDKHRELAR